MLKRLPWTRLLVEAALVVLSVLLALAVNSWRQNAINEDLAEQALRSIQEEIEFNQERVQRALDYHVPLLDSLRQNPDRGIALGQAFIQNNAWETAQATGAAAYIDYPVAAAVARVHSMQNQYETLSRTTLQVIYMGNVFMQPEAAPDRGRRFYPILQDFVSYERRLMQLYSEALEEIES